MAESGQPPARKAAAKTTPAKKAVGKKTPAKKAVAKKTPAKKVAEKAVAKKTSAKKVTKKSYAKKVTSTAPAAGSTTTRGKTSRSRLSAAREAARRAPMSHYFKRSRERARTMVNDPEALQRIAEESSRDNTSRSAALGDAMDDFRTLIRLVVAYARGNYRDIPVDSLVLVVAGLVYVVSPVDLIPDGIPVAGYLDDLAVVGWVVRSVRSELDAFRAWELGADATTEPADSAPTADPSY